MRNGRDVWNPLQTAYRGSIVYAQATVRFTRFIDRERPNTSRQLGRDGFAIRPSVSGVRASKWARPASPPYNEQI
jgi:hypothetical protein